MTVGMPGSGIGGLFYFCVVLWMPVHEAIQTVRGKSSAARWRQVGFHWGILGTILLTLWCEAALLDLGLEKLQEHHLATLLTRHAETGRGMFLGVGQFAALGSLITLCVIVVGASMAAAILTPWRSRRAQPVG